MVTKQVQDQRMASCKVCEHYTGKILGFIKVKSLARCAQCGCFLLAKTQIKDSKCPIGEW